MKKILLRILLGILALLVFLALPYFLKDRSYIPLEKIDLSELEYKEVTFTNTIDNIELAGMLFTPDGEGPFPTAIIIHGSGPSFRNSKWYLLTTRHLLSQGVAVLLPDKRGCEKSGGEWRGQSLETLSNDVLACIDFIKTQEYFEAKNIGLVGMSQGGWIAPIVSTRSKDLDFMISFSGPTCTATEQLSHEQIYNIAPYTYTFLAKWIGPTTVEKIQKMPHYPDMAHFDPIPYIKEVDIPMFYAFGENDTNVPIDLCIERLKENDLFYTMRVEIYQNGGHGIVENDDSGRLSQKFLSDMTNFIKSN